MSLSAPAVTFCRPFHVKVYLALGLLLALAGAGGGGATAGAAGCAVRLTEAFVDAPPIAGQVATFTFTAVNDGAVGCWVAISVAESVGFQPGTAALPANAPGWWLDPGARTAGAVGWQPTRQAWVEVDLDLWTAPGPPAGGLPPAPTWQQAGRYPLLLYVLEADSPRVMLVARPAGSALTFANCPVCRQLWAEGVPLVNELGVSFASEAGKSTAGAAPETAATAAGMAANLSKVGVLWAQLGPDGAFKPAEANAIDGFVRNGGALLVTPANEVCAGWSPGAANNFLQAMGTTIRFLSKPAAGAFTLAQAAVQAEGLGELRFSCAVPLSADRPATVLLREVGGAQIFGALQQVGKGYIAVLGAPLFQRDMPPPDFDNLPFIMALLEWLGR